MIWHNPKKSVLAGWIGAISLLASNYLILHFLFRQPKIGRLLEGTTTVLAEDGKIIHENLAKEFMTLDDLVAAIHRQSIEHVKEVRRCELDPNGTIVVFERHSTELEQIESGERAIIGRLDELLRRVEAIDRYLAPTG